MLFNSLEFAVFLPIVFAIYWACKRNLKLQNFIILISSYVFYGWWDWRFLGLIMLSTVVDYFIGKRLDDTEIRSQRKLLLYSSLAFNLGILAYFKYFNFFIDNFSSAFTLLGSQIEVDRLSIVLPVGISFYTFQTLSYSIDIYQRKIKHTNNFIAFSAFVAFFPQLVAGPIERASHLLPQFKNKRKFLYGIGADGLRQILWGLFKKIVIADRCAIIANDVFANYADYNASTLIIGAVAFSFQIYGDFSGYSDIAIGTSKLFGFNLMTNFKTPYFSRNIAEFWNRWHISLSTWFRDYVYIPLGGSRMGVNKTILNVLIVFTISGFWHGANWTFIVWGLVNGLLFIPLLIVQKNKKYNRHEAVQAKIPNLKLGIQILSTFCLTTLLWIIFRSDNIAHAFNYITSIFDPSLFARPIWITETLIVGSWIMFMLVIEWINKNEEHEFSIATYRPVTRRLLYLILVSSIFFFGQFDSNSFIYFQF
jgi:alginate O-acetyltransferase complex protein AlgI